MSPDEIKRLNGRYYTESNPFVLKPFKIWAKEVDLKNKTILEPFAGKNNLIQMLSKMNLCKRFVSYDIKPTNKYVKKRNTLTKFPTGYTVCISNPPWLGRYSAKRRNLKYPNIAYDDLYKYCLELALNNCENVGFIIPATFLQSGLFRDRLQSVVFLNNIMFNDTENPVCLALFTKHSNDTAIYYDDKCAGMLKNLEKYVPNEPVDSTIRFNDKNGKLGLIGIDNTKEPSIKFCKGSKIHQEVKTSSRSITRINLDMTNKEINDLNDNFNKFRDDTQDVFLTPFKGLRSDGKYRRRLDYYMARKILTTYA